MGTMVGEGVGGGGWGGCVQVEVDILGTLFLMASWAPRP